MDEQEPVYEVGPSDARPFHVPDAAAPGSAERGDAARGAAFWAEVKQHFEPQVRQSGLDGGIPEPDSPEFPAFLAKLNAKNGPLALSLVASIQRLRQQMAMPSSRASQRRERKRKTRRFLFMRQTPDGRWVADKTKAPFYGMTALLLIGGVLSAMYALPKLAGTAAISAETRTAPSNLPDQHRPIVEGKPAASAEAALKQSREDLARFRAEQSAQGVNVPAAQSGTKPRPSTALMKTTAPITESATPTSAFKVLSNEPNPPAPPSVPERSIQSSPNPPPAVFSPVPTAPVPAQRTVQAPAPATPISTMPQQNVAAQTVPQFSAFGAGVAPSSSAPGRTVSTTTTQQPLPTAPPTASSASSLPDREVPDINASFGDLATLPSPASEAAPKAPASRPPTPRASAVPEPLPLSPAPTSATSFGDVQGTARDVPAAVAAPASGTLAFSSGVVYERAPTPVAAAAPAAPNEAVTSARPASNAPSPETASAPAAADTPGDAPVALPVTPGRSETASTLPAETPFGSDASNPSAKIGATGPFKPLQQVSATLLTALRTPNGASVPVLAVTPDGGSFVGLATINATLARVDMQFRRYVAADGNIYSIDALAYSREPNGLTQGLAAEIQSVAPTLALDAAQNSANALNTYVQNMAAAAARGPGTNVAIGDNASLSGSAAATLAQTLLGGLGSTLRMPENTQSITRIATVKGNAPMVVIAGLGGEGR